MISLELVDPRYYHLDTCFCPLAPGVAIYYPPAFDEYGQRALREVVDELIPWPSPRPGTSPATRSLSAARWSPTSAVRSCIASWNRAVTRRSPRRWASSSNRADRPSASPCDWTARKRPGGNTQRAKITTKTRRKGAYTGGIFVSCRSFVFYLSLYFAHRHAGFASFANGMPTNAARSNSMGMRPCFSTASWNSRSLSLPGPTISSCSARICRPPIR